MCLLLQPVFPLPFHHHGNVRVPLTPKAADPTLDYANADVTENYPPHRGTNVTRITTMIIDTLDNADLYRNLGPRFAKAFDFLRNTDLSTLPDGRNEIDGEEVFAMVVDGPTRRMADAAWEAHLNYHDIQFVTEGMEQMGFANVEDLAVTKAYNADADAALYTGEGTMVPVPAGTFVVFAPQDGHMPSVAITEPTRVRKIVVKVKV